MQNQQPTFGANNVNGGSIIESAPGPQFSPAAPGRAPMPTGNPLASQETYLHPVTPQKKHNIIETLILLATIVIAIVFIWLYIQKYGEWKGLRMDVDEQIDAAVAMAIAENTTKMEEEFLIREKSPYRDFTGPADYGSLGFKYPKTWSVYIDKDASNGGDFEAYLNPVEVEPISSTTINALRVTIRNSSFDSVVTSYDNYVMSGSLALTTRNVGGVLANIYTGQLPNGIQGILAAFKLRDKTVLIQTDAELFANEFYQLLDTVTMNQ